MIQCKWVSGLSKNSYQNRENTAHNMCFHMFGVSGAERQLYSGLV